MSFELHNKLICRAFSPYVYSKKNIYTHYTNDALAYICKNKLRKNNSTKICFLPSSSSFEYGWKIGRCYKFQYHFIDFLARLLRQIKINKVAIKEYLNKIKCYSPSILEEFKGLSFSTNIKLERLVFLHILLCSIFGSSCTSILATGKATKNDDTFLIQNLDHGLILTILVRLFTFKIWINSGSDSNDYKYAFIGIPVLLENPLINQEGLGLGQTTTLCNKNMYVESMKRFGVDINILIRNTMKTCKNVHEVAELWKSTKIAYRRHNDQTEQSTAWCDKDGGIMSMEVGPDLIETVFGDSIKITGTKEGILWHARHHQWLDGRKTGSYIPSECYYSILNANRALELLEMNYGNISLDTCKRIARDHGKEKDDGLCKHPDKKRMVFTCCSYIVQPKKLSVYMTHGSPCKSKFKKHVFTGL